MSTRRCTVADLDRRQSIERPAVMTRPDFRWVDQPWREVDSVAWRNVQPSPRGGWILPEYFQWGDYCGSTVDRANYETFLEEYASVRTRANGKPNWLTVYGDYGSHAIAISVSFLLSEEGQDMWESLCALSDYPFMSDDAHSELEMRLESEAWENYGTHDLRRELIKCVEAEDRADLADALDDDTYPWERILQDAVYDQTYDGKAYTSPLHAAWERHSPSCEGADSCHLPVEKWAEHLTIEQIADLVGTARSLVQTWTTLGAHACLGCRETSAAGTQERLFAAGGYECHYPGCPDARHVPTPGLAKVDGSRSNAAEVAS